MVIARSTMSLFGFLATTALGAGLTFVNKNIGIGVAVTGAVCSATNLMYNLCFRKNTPVEPNGKNWNMLQDHLAEDENADFSSVGGALDADAVNDIEVMPGQEAVTVSYRPNIVTRMLYALMRIGQAKEPSKEH